MPEPLRSPELTARWESRLSRVAEGLEPAEGFRADIRRNAGELVAQVKASTAEYRPRNPGASPCPVCGRPLLAVQDRRGRKLLACQALSCGYEQGAQTGDGPHRPSPREKAITRRMLREYNDDAKDTSSFGELIRAAQEKKKQP